MFNDMYNLFLPDSNQMIYKLARTRIFKRSVNSLFVLIISLIIRSLLYTYFSIIIMFNNETLDFFTQCGISIMLCLNNNYIQGFVDRFSDDLYLIPRYIINNFSEENYRKWKLYSTFIVLGLLYVYFLFFEISSYLMRIYILQYALCFIFMDVAEKEDHYVRKKLNFIFSPITKLFKKIKIKIVDGIDYGQYCVIDNPSKNKDNNKLIKITDNDDILKNTSNTNNVKIKSILKKDSESDGFINLDNKKKVHGFYPTISSEFDMVSIPKSQSGFEIVE